MRRGNPNDRRVLSSAVKRESQQSVESEAHVRWTTTNLVVLGSKYCGSVLGRQGTGGLFRADCSTPVRPFPLERGVGPRPVSVTTDAIVRVAENATMRSSKWDYRTEDSSPKNPCTPGGVHDVASKLAQARNATDARATAALDIPAMWIGGFRLSGGLTLTLPIQVVLGTGGILYKLRASKHNEVTDCAGGIAWSPLGLYSFTSSNRRDPWHFR